MWVLLFRFYSELFSTSVLNKAGKLPALLAPVVQAQVAIGASASRRDLEGMLASALLCKLSGQHPAGSTETWEPQVGFSRAISS